MSNDQHYFLNGGGEMGNYIRAKDWSETVLGTPDTWPQSLRTTLSIILNSKFPMYLWWGTELTSFYNDAYRVILGNNGKHPQMLGQKAEIAWPEIWPTLHPLIDYVLQGNGATWSEDQLIPIYRNNKMEDAYWTFSYSPVFEESGKIAGVMVIGNETTKNVFAFNKLKESEKRFKTLADNIPNLAWMAEPNGNVYWYNKKWYEYTGKTIEEMRGWGWQSVYREEDLPEVLKEWRQSLEVGVPFEMSYPIKGKDGTYRQFLTRALPVKNKKGDIINWFGTNTDITNQKQTEEALIESNNQLEFVLEAAQLGTFDYNPITDKLSGNNRLKKWFGLASDEQFKLSDATNSIIESDKQNVLIAINNALNNSPTGNYDIPYNIINPISKEKITLHAKGKVWFNNEGEAYRFNGTVEDITAQTITRKKIEQSESMLRLMILQAPIAISIIRGPNYIVEIANKSALQLWGKSSQEEVLNKSIFESIPELLSQGIKEILDNVVATGKRFFTKEFPVQIMQFGALETLYVNFSCEPLYDEKGIINGIMIIGFDVSEQFFARQKIEKSEQSIRSLVESAPFPIGVFTGREMRITLANQSIIEAWGKGKNIIGKLYSEILPELENQNIFKQLDDVFITGNAFHAKNQLVTIFKDGRLKPHYFNYSLTPLLDSFGNIYGIMNTAADVTELHEAKQKIEESEKRFRDAIHQAPVAIAVFRGNNHIVETVNTPYLELVEKKESEFLGIPLFESLPEVEAVIKPIIDEIYKNEKAFYGHEFPVPLLRNGKKEMTYYNVVYHPLKEGNIVTGIMVIATEVTSIVTAKKALEENEQKLNIVINASELGVWELDLEGEISTMSDRGLEILGFPNQKNVSHKTLMKNLHPDDLGIRADAFKKAFENGTLYYEIRIIINNEIHWIETKGKVFFDSQNKPIKLLGTLREVTEEKRFQARLLEREQKFRLLADSMPQLIWTSDTKGNLNYFNQAVFNFSGYSLEKIKDKGWIVTLHKDEKEETIRKWKESVATEKDFLFEHRFRKSDGTYRWQLSRAIPQRDQEGKITMWVGTSTDIQDQKMFTNELENKVSERTRQLNQKNLDLERMNKELESFAYISSHDLQEPLRKIQTFATQINEKEAGNLSEAGKEKFKRMQSAANRMQNLIQDLLAYSRTSVQERIFENTTLCAIIEEVKEYLNEDLLLKNATITVLNDCNINVIAFQFRQLLFNLISNSLKFTREGTDPVITIDCEIVTGSILKNEKLDKTIQYCHIKIQDNGIGFEAEYTEKIFEVFQRLHGKEKFDGTGIGLAIVKKIVENHNGIISATGVLNEGATFDIYLPY